MKIYSVVHGIYSRSESLIAATRAFDRGRIKKKEVEKIFYSDRKNLLKVYSNLKIDFFNDGMLDAQDIFRPIIYSARNLFPGTLTRFFDTNTFFRQPEITGKPKLIEKNLKENYHLSTVDYNSLTLPSPITFKNLSGSKKYYIDEYFCKIVDTLTKLGIKQLVFHEPHLTYLLNSRSNQTDIKNEVMELNNFFSKIKKENISIILLTYFGNAEKILDKLISVPVDILGFDCYRTSIEKINKFDLKNKSLFLGVIDSGNSLIENPISIKKFVEKIIKKLNPTKIYLGNNYSLEFVPQKIAEKKLLVLSKIVNELKKKYE